MDSFYDAPRHPFVPTQVDRILPNPMVPEVSLLCSSKTPVNHYQSYDTWKQHQNPTSYVLTTNGHNIRGPHNPNQPTPFASPQNTSQFLKKQVRFESPVLQQRPSLTYEPFLAKKSEECCEQKTFQSKPNSSSTHTNAQPLGGKTFEEIYMANVPNRHLDLSLIDLPNCPKQVEKAPVILEEKEPEVYCEKDMDSRTNSGADKENQLPKTYREFLQTQKWADKKDYTSHNDSVTDIFNYKRSKALNASTSDMDHKKTPNKPTVKQKDSRSEFISNTARSPIVSGNFQPQQRLLNKPNVKIKGTENSSVLNKEQPPPGLGNIPEFRHSESQNYSPISHQAYRESIFPHTGFPPPINPDFPQSPYHCNQAAANQFYQHQPPVHQNLSTGRSDRLTQTSNLYSPPLISAEPTEKREDSETTNKDLLKIIAQQNEQLLILQKQVAMLLSRDQQQNQPKQLEGAQRMNYIGENCVTSTQNENFRNPLQDTPRKRGLSKFSIDLMTSFEVAIRPQNNVFQNKQNFVNYEPKIQEITETESVETGCRSGVEKNEKTVVDTSIHLEEPVNVREMCPSPEPSININMNDYDSSDEEAVSASEIGATFYQNLMGQVNNILKKAHAQTKEDMAGAKNNAVSDKVRDKTMSRVKEATLKHLKNIGVTIGPLDDSDSSESSGNDSKDYSPTEISFAVKQLLMKYLPDEQLAKITCKQAPPLHTPKEDNPGIMKTRPEFSFASVQYMKKYNLIPNSNDPKPFKGADRPPRPSQPQKLDCPKILDMTALKMQPKLL